MANGACVLLYGLPTCTYVSGSIAAVYPLQYCTFSLSVTFRQVIQNKDQTRIAQAKILMVLIYHVVLGASTLTAFTVASRNFPLFLDELLKYFICESAGTGEACDRSGFNKYNNTVASTISFVVLALAPVVNLVYVMKFLSMRETCLRWCGRKEKSTSGENISSSTSNSSPNETRVLHMNRLN